MDHTPPVRIQWPSHENKGVRVDEDQAEDIQPGNFAIREMDRSDKGALNRIFDELDDGAKQELLRLAVKLRRSATQPL